MEFGGGLGGMLYVGDLSQKIRPKFLQPAGTFFYRHNSRNGYTAFRFGVLAGNLYADQNEIDEPLAQVQGLSFKNLTTEFHALFEYNFLDFRDERLKYYLSPYLFGGVGVTVVWQADNPTVPSIPFGIGLKYVLSKHWNLGAEFGARKTFSDKLDGYAEDETLMSSTNKDWYYFTGITVSYTVYRQLCSKCSPQKGQRPVR